MRLSCVLLWIDARIVFILKRRSKCRQLRVSGLGYSYLTENRLLVFLFLTDLAACPDLFILDTVLPFDLTDCNGFFSFRSYF